MFDKVLLSCYPRNTLRIGKKDRQLNPKWVKEAQACPRAAPAHRGEKRKSKWLTDVQRRSSSLPVTEVKLRVIRSMFYSSDWQMFHSDKSKLLVEM